jgi:hypothetical protein
VSPQRLLRMVGSVLSVSGQESVFLHCDFHGYNLVVDEAQSVEVVLDLDEASIGDHHYDFRYLPAQAPSVELFQVTVPAYEHSVLPAPAASGSAGIPSFIPTTVSYRLDADPLRGESVAGQWTRAEPADGPRGTTRSRTRMAASIRARTASPRAGLR